MYLYPRHPFFYYKILPPADKIAVMDGTKIINHPAPRTAPAGADSVNHESNHPLLVDAPTTILETHQKETFRKYRNQKHVSTCNIRTWGKTAALGWLASLLFHLGLALAFLVLSLYRKTPDLQNKPNLQTPVQTAFTDLQMAPVISDLKVESMLTDDFVPENPELPGLPNTLPANSPPAASGNLAVFSDSRSGFTVPANTIRAGNPYRSEFCGTGGSGQGICYVVDCSGSMVMALEYVRSELRRAIERLTPAQYFQVIFYAGGAPLELEPGRLIRASAPHRQRALEFVDQVKLNTVPDTASGSQAVVNAMERALTAATTHHLQANLIYLLTDGQYDHGYVESAVKKIQAQRIRPARINVISCGVKQNENFLRRLALNYQGSYHFVSDEEMAERK